MHGIPSWSDLRFLLLCVSCFFARHIFSEQDHNNVDVMIGILVCWQLANSGVDELSITSSADWACCSTLSDSCQQSWRETKAYKPLLCDIYVLLIICCVLRNFSKTAVCGELWVDSATQSCLWCDEIILKSSEFFVPAGILCEAAHPWRLSKHQRTWEDSLAWCKDYPLTSVNCWRSVPWHVTMTHFVFQG